MIKREISPVLVLTSAIVASSLWLWVRAVNALDREADVYMRRQVTDSHFSGVALISKAGRVQFLKAYGYANEEWRVPNTVRTKFRIGSLTKQFTATLVMRLQQEGKLHISDPVCHYFDPCPKAWGSLKVQHLLTHTSGIENFTDDPGFATAKRKPLTQAELIENLSGRTLAFPPGERFQYSNSNYYLLGMIIEKVTGRRYEQILQSEILQPLGLADTGYDHPETVMPERAGGYVVLPNGTMRAADFVDMSWAFSAGALYSTAVDLEKWNEALVSKKVLPAAALQTMWTPFKGGYGYGWEIPARSPLTLNRRMIMHSGSIDGFVSCMDRFLDSNVTIVVLSNHVMLENACTMAIELAAIAFGDNDQLTRPSAEIKLDSVVLRRYVGRYRFAPDVIIQVALREDQLFASTDRLPPIQMRAESERQFFFKELEWRIEFTIDLRDQVTGIDLYGPDGVRRFAPRIVN